ncbi:MAG: MBL fold metallo-hydrolase [Pseudomonadales bacterium]|nr:MAG: MBL fold metallo-hydrolase [Pseudomonadales bacterium]
MKGIVLNIDLGKPPLHIIRRYGAIFYRPPRLAPTKAIIVLVLCTLCSLLQAQSKTPAIVTPTAATEHTRSSQAKVLSDLPFADREDYAVARRGLIESAPNLTLKNKAGRVIWSLVPYQFLNGERPDTVNPSLWRHAQLAYNSGLFKVVDGIYQVRGFDTANISIVEAPEGLIIIDPLATQEQARAAMELYFKHRPRLPVKAIVYTHPHVDHYGGVEGVVSRAQVASGEVDIFAPENFMQYMVSEWAIGGTTMGRRGMYQFGVFLPRGPRAHVDNGMGKSTGSGSTSVIAPTRSVSQPVETHRIAGLEVEFQHTPGTESPAEMNLFIPAYAALCTAENATASLHNLLTLRGAEVRDARQWAYYLRNTIDLYASRSVVAFNTHHWPRWGKEKVFEYLERTADTYQYIHDQTLRLAAQGLTMNDIANAIEMPAALQESWYTRGYYGTASVGARAVFQRYFGFFDGNPANLDPLPRVQEATRMIDYMGGPNAAYKRAKQDFDKGDYRVVAKVLSYIVDAQAGQWQGQRNDNSKNYSKIYKKSRDLLAKTYDQLGYQAESALWRNFYLTGAHELRNGVPNFPLPPAIAKYVNEMDYRQLFDALAVRLDGARAENTASTINFIIDEGNGVSASRYIRLKNAVLAHREGQAASADLVVKLSRPVLEQLVAGALSPGDAIDKNLLDTRGDVAALRKLFALLDPYSYWFPIVTPATMRMPANY